MTSEFAIAVHALVYLNHKQETLASVELAKNVCTNPARIRKVMAKLKKKNAISCKAKNLNIKRKRLLSTPLSII